MNTEKKIWISPKLSQMNIEKVAIGFGADLGEMS
jgi:hypothetical protein